MTRLSRKNREDIIFKGRGGITDVFDDAIKQQWRINDEELNWFCENATDEEIGYIVIDAPTTYEEMRKAITCVNSLLIRFNKEKKII